jgi:hypothetical protein
MVAITSTIMQQSFAACTMKLIPSIFSHVVLKHRTEKGMGPRLLQIFGFSEATVDSWSDGCDHINDYATVLRSIYNEINFIDIFARAVEASHRKRDGAAVVAHIWFL